MIRAVCGKKQRCVLRSANALFEKSLQAQKKNTARTRLIYKKKGRTANGTVGDQSAIILAVKISSWQGSAPIFQQLPA